MPFLFSNQKKEEQTMAFKSRGVNFDGEHDESFVTFANHATSGFTRATDEDGPVKVAGNGTGAKCDAEDDFFGIVKIIDPDDGALSVQDKGYTKVTYTGSAPTAGNYERLVGDGSGGVKIKAAGAAVGDKYYHVVSVDTTNTTVTFDLG